MSLNGAGDWAKYSSLEAGLATHAEGRVERPDGEPPPDSAWRYRTSGPPRWFALFGVIAGFIALIVPGLVALRSYRRWIRNETSHPRFAWFMADIGAAVVILGAIALWSVPIALYLGVLAGVPFVIISAVRLGS